MAWFKCSFCGKSAGNQLKSKDLICNDCIKKLGGMKHWFEIRKMSPEQIRLILEQDALSQERLPSPSVHTSTKSKNGLMTAVLVSFGIIIAIGAISIIAISNGFGTLPESSKTTQGEAVSRSSERVVYENADIKVVYQGVTDVVGNVGFQFTLENKTGDEIMVLPESASINDHMVQLFSGVPATIRAGKKLNQVWFTGLETAGITNYKDVKEIELVLQYAPSDALMSKNKKTKLIHIDV